MKHKKDSTGKTSKRKWFDTAESRIKNEMSSFQVSSGADNFPTPIVHPPRFIPRRCRGMNEIQLKVKVFFYIT